MQPPLTPSFLAESTEHLIKRMWVLTPPGAGIIYLSFLVLEQETRRGETLLIFLVSGCVAWGKGNLIQPEYDVR